MQIFEIFEISKLNIKFKNISSGERLIIGSET